MSISIMDAYRAKIGDMSTFTKFIGDITTAYKYFLLEAYAEQAKDTIIKLTERLPYLKYTHPERYSKIYKRFEERALAAYAKATARKRNYPDPVYPDISFDEMLHELPVKDIAKMIAFKSINPEQTAAKLYICPIGHHVLIKASGENFRYFMRTLPEALKSTYQIKDWHWQDRYGKPSDISKTEWDARRRTWERVQSTWSKIEQSMSEPGRGFAIDIFDFDKFEEWIASNDAVQQKLEDSIRRLITKEETGARLDAWAYMETRHEYVAEMKYEHEKYESKDPALKLLDPERVNNIQYELATLFDKNAHKPGSRANDMLNATRSAMEKYMVEFGNPYRIYAAAVKD